MRWRPTGRRPSPSGSTATPSEEVSADSPTVGDPPPGTQGRVKRRTAPSDKQGVTLPANQKLRQKASLAMRSGDHREALRIYRELSRLEPDDPTWPERCADACHALGETDEELACLRRSLSLLVDDGQVLPAIATCKLILDIRPEDPDALDCLHLLYSEPGLDCARPSASLSARMPASRVALPERDDAPLEELELTEVIADARTLTLGDGIGVAEIPLGDPATERLGLDDLDVDLVDAVRSFESSAPSPAHRRRPAAEIDPRAPARLVRDELARTPLFGSLDVTTLHRLLARVRIVSLVAGEVLFQEGDPADALFVVVEGAVVPIAEGPPRRRMAVLEKGAFFGEIGLVTNRPRNATIEAIVDTRLLAIDRELMWSLIRREPDVSKVLLRFLRERLIDRTVRTHPFFAPFGQLDLRAVARQFRFLEVRDGSTVLDQGQPSGGLFVLLAGSMDVVDEVTDKVRSRLEPGDLFGGVSVVRREPAAASVIADGKCWVLVLEASPLRRLLAARPGVEDALVAGAAARATDV